MRKFFATSLTTAVSEEDDIARDIRYILLWNAESDLISSRVLPKMIYVDCNRHNIEANFCNFLLLDFLCITALKNLRNFSSITRESLNGVNFISKTNSSQSKNSNLFKIFCY